MGYIGKMIRCSSWALLLSSCTGPEADTPSDSNVRHDSSIEQYVCERMGECVAVDFPPLCAAPGVTANEVGQCAECLRWSTCAEVGGLGVSGVCDDACRVVFVGPE